MEIKMIMLAAMKMMTLLLDIQETVKSRNKKKRRIGAIISQENLRAKKTQGKKPTGQTESRKEKSKKYCQSRTATKIND